MCVRDGGGGAGCDIKQSGQIRPTEKVKSEQA